MKENKSFLKFLLIILSIIFISNVQSKSFDENERSQKDLSAIIDNSLLRVLVVYDNVSFFMKNGRQAGLHVALMKQFKEYLIKNNYQSAKDLKIYFRSGKMIDITAEEYELLRNAFQEEELISFGTTNRVSRVKSLGIYKARFNSLSDNDDVTNSGDVERRYRFCQRRLMLIAKDLGINITSGSIQESGFLHYIREGMQRNNLDFLQYIKTEECKLLARRYDLYTDLYMQIVKDKFLQYFQ
jgi:hypothetical protein